MKYVKRMAMMLLALVFVFVAGCSSSSAEGPDENVEINGVSTENPMLFDEEAGTITVLARVNGKYFTEPTRHAAVYYDGGFGDKSIFTAFADQNQFYENLISLGAEPGNNMNADTAAETHVEGDKMNIEVDWEGNDKPYALNDVVIDSNGNDLDMRFGGNKDSAKEKHTGCLSCFDSCPVGIISNSTYTYGAVEKRNEVEFTGNADVLPEDGTYVTLTYSVEK